MSLHASDDNEFVKLTNILQNNRESEAEGERPDSGPKI